MNATPTPAEPGETQDAVPSVEAAPAAPQPAPAHYAPAPPLPGGQLQNPGYTAHPYGQQQYQQPYQQYPTQYGYPNGYAPSAPKGLSITAMVLGIAGLVIGWLVFMLPSLGAVIFGHIGLKKEPAGRGMAIAGLITGYVGLGIGLIFFFFLVLVAILPLLFLPASFGY